MRLVSCGRVFIGQGSGKGKEKGMSQKEQQAALAAFRIGEYNVMIATCIAEEGLDIPQVMLLGLSPALIAIQHVDTDAWWKCISICC